MVRQEDSIARYGGEEFLAVLPRTAPAAVRAAVDRWMTAWGEKDSPITFSAGIAQHQAGRLVGATVLEADRALYRAKQEGRNRVYAELS